MNIEGLSREDIRAYYGGCILLAGDRLFKVASYDNKKFVGHELIDSLWVPSSVSPSKASLVFPKEGYVHIKGYLYYVTQTIRKTRRKGMNEENYRAHGLSPKAPPVNTLVASSLLALFNDETSNDYEEAIKQLRRKECRGYLFSKKLCINKKGASREVHLRGVRVGVIKKDGLELSPDYEALKQEIQEFNIPITEKRKNETKPNKQNPARQTFVQPQF